MNDSLFRFADDLGPAKILHLHLAEVGLKAVVVVDNTACGPAIGGVRMAPDVDRRGGVPARPGDDAQERRRRPAARRRQVRHHRRPEDAAR